MDAAHAEYGAGGTPVVTPLACSLDGDEITIDVTPGSRLSALHATRTLREFTTCNYGLAPEFAYLANAHGLRVSAVEVSDRETNAEVRAIERTDHPFFLGTLYQPQLRSSQEEPHPVFLGLLRAAAGQ